VVAGMSDHPGSNENFHGGIQVALHQENSLEVVDVNVSHLFLEYYLEAHLVVRQRETSHED